MGVCAYLGAELNTEGLPACSLVCVRCSKRLLTGSCTGNRGGGTTNLNEIGMDISSPTRVESKKTTAIARSTAAVDDTYSDFNFWRVPIPNLDD